MPFGLTATADEEGNILAKKLRSNGNKETFMAIFSDPTPNKVLKIKDLFDCLKALGAKIEFGKGSGFKFRIEIYNAKKERDIYVDGINPEYVTDGAHRPHGPGSDGTVLSYVVKMFRSALERAVITPEVVFPLSKGVLQVSLMDRPGL